MSLRDQVLDHGATEPPHSGKLLHHDQDGSYSCGRCGAALFDSKTKFDSGSGWPSFHDALPDSVIINIDKSHGMVREEVKCKTCKSHLGHRFPDGPNPTGLRYCINSAAMCFIDEDNNKIDG